MSSELELESIDSELESNNPELESSDSELEDSSIGPDYTVKYGPLSVPGFMVSVKVKDGAPYNIPLEVLVEDSMYFMRAVFPRPRKDGQMALGDSHEIEIDISSKDFGLYVSVMYPAVLCKTELELQQVWTIVDRDGPYVRHPFPLVLLLWQLGDRFENGKVMSIAEAELKTALCDYSTHVWQSLYVFQPIATLKKRMLRLQNAFRLCQDKQLPFGHYFIKAASQVVPQVFAACADDLDDEVFRSKVTRAFALRFADPGFTDIKRKRKADEWREIERQSKKHKIDN